MADWLIFRRTGEREDGAPVLDGPLGPPIRGTKADDPEAAIAQVGNMQIGDHFVAVRYDTAVELVVEGPPRLTRLRG